MTTVDDQKHDAAGGTMIDLYGTGSPNVLKIAIMLEETGRPYKGHFVQVMSGDNFTPAFVALNPLAKVPVIVDHDGAGKEQPLFESGAILIYLAETYGSQFLPTEGPARWEVLTWLMVQISYAGPMLGQVNHFQLIPSESQSYAAGRYRDQAAHVYRILNDRLAKVKWLGGEEYSIADISMYPWAAYLERHGFDPAEYPHLVAWRELIDDRPAVKRAVLNMAEFYTSKSAPPTERQIDGFFGRRTPGPAADVESYFALGPMITAKP